MRVEINLSPEIKEAYAVIHGSKMTDEIRRVAEACESQENVIAAMKEEKIVVLQPEEIYMIRVEDGKIYLYTERDKYQSGKKLYEFEESLGRDFMRISKSTIVNLKKMDSVETSFHAMMYLVMKNGCKDYITRTYLPEFKKYLGL